MTTKSTVNILISVPNLMFLSSTYSIYFSKQEGLFCRVHPIINTQSYFRTINCEKVYKPGDFACVLL